MSDDTAQMVAWLRETLTETLEAAKIVQRTRGKYRLHVCSDGHIEEPDRYGDNADSDKLPNHHNIWLPLFDPADVIADCEAKLTIIDLCEPPLVDATGPGDREPRYLLGAGPPWGEPVLRQLAFGLRHREGWQDRWKP